MSIHSDNWEPAIAAHPAPAIQPSLDPRAAEQTRRYKRRPAILQLMAGMLASPDHQTDLDCMRRAINILNRLEAYERGENP